MTATQAAHEAAKEIAACFTASGQRQRDEQVEVYERIILKWLKQAEPRQVQGELI